MSGKRDVRGSEGLLLDVGVPFMQGADGLLVEAQALNGIRLWATHFGHVTVCAPILIPDDAFNATSVYVEPADLLATGRVSLEAFPWGYHVLDHFRYRAEVRKRYEALVAQHRYLCFTNIGSFGAWGSFGVEAAISQGRPFAIWLDLVVHEWVKSDRGASSDSIRSKIKSILAKRATDLAVEHCSLGLFHGKTVYDAYAPFCRQPELVHDIHISPQDEISDEMISARLTARKAGGIFRVGYLGRAHPMKAPLQWLEAIAIVAESIGPARLQATWLGDGPLLEPARERVRELGLESVVQFRGFVADRGEILDFLRAQDVFAFCHVTPESPRCLIEALISGLPIVGYDSSYARELVEGRGGAMLSAVGDPAALAANLIGLVEKPVALERLTWKAASNRGIYNDEAVFRHRSELIHQYL